MDWQLGNRVPNLGKPLNVWMTNGSVRAVRHVHTMMGPALHFTDCNHPAQNVVCDDERVQAWKLATPQDGG